MITVLSVTPDKTWLVRAIVGSNRTKTVYCMCLLYTLLLHGYAVSNLVLLNTTYMYNVYCIRWKFRHCYFCKKASTST